MAHYIIISLLPGYFSTMCNYSRLQVMSTLQGLLQVDLSSSAETALLDNAWRGAEVSKLLHSTPLYQELMNHHNHTLVLIF